MPSTLFECRNKKLCKTAQTENIKVLFNNFRLNKNSNEMTGLL